MIRIIILVLLSQAAWAARSVSVRDYGAAGNGVKDDHDAVQVAIDEAAGGGVVRFPRGEWKAGELQLRSGVRIEMAAGATIIGGFVAQNVHHVQIAGAGVTSLIRGFSEFHDSTDLSLDNFAEESFSDQGFYACRGIRISHVTLRQPEQRSTGGSAIWLTACEDVVVSDSDFSSNDDVFCLKRSAKNILLTRMKLRGNLAAPFKIGTETDGAFSHIVFTDSDIVDSDRGAISIESVDGSLIDGVFISKIRMTNVNAPFFIRLGGRDRYGKGVGAVRNILIENITATGGDKDEGIGASVTGIPGHPVENVTFSHIRMKVKGGGSEASRRSLPAERETSYPEFDIFGPLPAYGLYARHVTGLTLSDFTVEYQTEDARPPLMFEDVDRLTLNSVTAAATLQAGAVVVLQGVSGATVLDSRAPPDVAFETRREARPIPKSVTQTGPEAGKVWIGARQFGSIAEGLAAAQRGDVVMVGPGLYALPADQLPLRLAQPGVRLRSSAGSGRTILEARGAREQAGKDNAVVLIVANDTGVEGFTIRRGTYDIYAEGADRVTIRGNTVEGSKRSNITINGGHDSSIAQNTSDGSLNTSISIQNCTRCVVEDNTITDPAGVSLSHCEGSRIENNRFQANAWYGAGVNQSTNTVVRANRFEGGRLLGLQISGSSGTTVERNRFTGNKQDAVLVNRGSSGVSVSQNVFESNKSYAIANESQGVVDAKNNWWGSAQTPGHLLMGPVNYQPWLETSPDPNK